MAIWKVQRSNVRKKKLTQKWVDVPAWNQSRIYYINHISTLICTFLENLKKNGQEMKATQKNFQSLLLNDYKSVKMRFGFVYDYPRPFSNTKYQKNGQKKWWLCVPAGHASNPIYYINWNRRSFCTFFENEKKSS